MTRFYRLRSRTARWWCIILAPLAWRTRRIRLLKPCDSFATTAGSDLCSWVAEHGVSSWNSSAERNGSVHAEFRPYASRSELGRSLAEGHVGLVTQIPETMGAVVPSKTYGIMAAGRPMLYVGPQGATPARILERQNAAGESSRGTSRAWSDFLNGWSRIEVWCRRRGREPGARLRNTTTGRSE